MTRLALYLLGTPRVELNGEPVHIGRRKALALLVYLALEEGVHSRERLATLLWPEQDQRRARANLRDVLLTLNRALGEGWLEADRDSVCLVDQRRPESVVGHTLPEQPSLWTDVAQFRQHLAACETHGHPATTACIECQNGLSEAVELYRDEFMSGFTLTDSLAFDEWQRFQTEGLRDELGSALERLVGCLTAQGAYEEAIAEARRWLVLDPTREGAHRVLMGLYAQVGRSAAALRQYRQCVRILEEELGAPPAAETTTLYERIRAERNGPVEVEAAPVAPQPSVAGVAAFLSQEAEPAAARREVFVARARELARLGEFLEEALAGRGKVAFVTGGPGRGKTALLRAFAAQAMAVCPDLLVASGNCSAFSGVGDPYLPFREALGMLTGDVEFRWAAGTLSTEHAQRLWNALPETVRALLDHGPQLIDALVPGAALLSRIQTLSGASSPVASELQKWLEWRREAARGLDQERIFQQVADTLAALSCSHPLLLTLDDLQWTDGASASLLFHLGRQLADVSGRVLILGAYRPEEVALDRPILTPRSAQATSSGERERHPMQKVLSEFRRHYGDVCLDLKSADQEGSRAFVDAYLDNPANPMAPNRLDDGFRTTLSARTTGHPLFTIELLRGMQERDELVRDRDGAWIAGPTLDWDRLPARVEAAIQERIERLGREQRDLLTVASVEGEVFTAQAVAQVQGLGEREVLRLMSQELGPHSHRLVRDAGEVSVAGDGLRLSRYQFCHALFQTYLYDRLSTGERRLLHGEMGEALEGLYGEHADLIAPALAYHFEVAWQLEKAAAYALRAGDLAAEMYAYEEAAQYFLSSLGLCRKLGNRAREVDSLMGLGLALGARDKRVEKERCMQDARRIYRELGDRTGEANALRHLVWSCVSQGDAVRGEDYLRQTATICEEIGEPRIHANAIGGLGRLYREHVGDFERARACGEETLRLGQEAGSLANEGIGRINIGFALHYQGDYTAAEPYMTDGVRLLEECGRRGDSALSLVGLGLNAIALGDYGAAAAHLEQTRRTFRELRCNDLDDDAWAQSALALLYHQQDDDQTARGYAARAATIHRKTSYDYRTAVALTRLGHALTALGELSAACTAYQEALDLRRRMGQHHLVPENLAGLARVALAQDDPEGALAYTEEILSRLETGHLSTSSGCSINGTDEPLRIYLTCYRVLKANNDLRATEMLTEAHSLLQERAAKIDDEALRRSYLENVKAHRELVYEWQAVQRETG